MIQNQVGTVPRMSLLTVTISVADPCLWPMDPDPDPTIFFIGLQEPTKNYFLNFFCLLLFEGTSPSFFIDKKSTRSHKTVGIMVFLTIFAWWQKDTEPDPDPYLWGQKTSGSDGCESATLVTTLTLAYLTMRTLYCATSYLFSRRISSVDLPENIGPRISWICPSKNQ